VLGVTKASGVACISSGQRRRKPEARAGTDGQAPGASCAQVHRYVRDDLFDTSAERAPAGAKSLHAQQRKGTETGHDSIGLSRKTGVFLVDVDATLASDWLISHASPRVASPGAPVRP
jgi:hypothetical protein